MVLDTIQDGLPVAFSVLFALWIVLSGYMVVDRIFYDATEGKLRRAIADVSARATQSDAELEARLDATSRRMLEKLASDLRTPERVARIIAARLVDGTGMARYLRRARGSAKWRRIASLHILFHAEHDGLLALLEEALETDDADVVDASISLLGNVRDPRAAQLLVQALTERRYSASRIATQLDHFPVPVSREISVLLTAPEASLRYWGVTLLARYKKDSRLCELVAMLATDPHEHVRKAVAETLGAIGEASPEKAESALLRLVTDANWIVRAHGARALADLARVQHSESIAPLLADQEWWVRLAAKESLVAMGEGAVGTAVRYLEHHDRFARNGAAEVLQNLGYLDRILAVAVERGPRSDEGALVRKALAAGGSGMIASYVMRQDETSQASVEGLLDGLDLSSAGE